MTRPVYITRLSGDEGGGMRRVTVEYFDDAKGYDQDDLKAIQRLGVGATWNASGRGVSKSVKRIA